MIYRASTHHTAKHFPTHSDTKLWIKCVLATMAGSIFLTASGLSAAQALTSAAEAVTTPLLLISEVQTRGCKAGSTPCTEDDSQEYVQVYNPAQTPLQVSGWKLRYYNSSGTGSDLATFSGTFAAHGYAILAHGGTYDSIADITFAANSTANKLYKTVGHVAIVDSSDKTVDLVGWGSGATMALPAPSAAAAPATVPELGKVLQRKADVDGALLHTANNANDFVTVAMAQPLAGGFSEPDPEVVAPPDDSSDINTTSCEGVIISETLPNPAGTDTGHEFIELHNPTDEVIDLMRCSLQSSASSTKTYDLTGVAMQPGEYRSLGDAATGLSLPNGAGGTVWLLSPNDELQSITYPVNMADDAAWALKDGGWAATFTPTPGAANIVTPLKPCEDPAQVRNAETGRCATPQEAGSTPTSSGAAASSGLAPCKTGQERNPETNRCRAIATATSTPAACKAGQERNPETNRCKAVGSTTATKDCPAGQERNPETNRCRKVLDSGSGGNITDIKDTTGGGEGRGTPYWLVGVAAGILVIGYAVYEWRQEIVLFARKISAKLSSGKAATDKSFGLPRA